MRSKPDRWFVIPPGTAPQARLLLWVRALRSFGDGYMSLLLPFYLISLGFGAIEVGAITTATLLGSGATTLGVGLIAHRISHRTLLLTATLLMTATGLAFAAFTGFWPLLVVAVVGTLNPTGGDVSFFLPLEQALLSGTVQDRHRTALFARYSLIGTLVGAFGALAAGLPEVFAQVASIEIADAFNAMFVLYGGLGVVCFLVYRRLGPGAAAKTVSSAAPLQRSRRIVYSMAAVFSLDSFGSGFVAQSLLALWLFERFDLSPSAAGTVFFWTGVLAALSFLAAVPIARRIGLINTMFWTHLPSNVLLALVPFMPTLPLAILLLVVRSALSQMDVPTRTSYVMAVVPPEERPAAASVTAVPRSWATAVSPFFSGYLLHLSPFGWPLVIAGALKIVYDLLLLYMFRSHLPPEERR